jgi:hypothetical protein
MTDVRPLVNRKPTGQRAQQLISAQVSLQQPAPTSTSDPLYVTTSWLPSLEVQKWPPLGWGSMPQGGDFVTVAQTDDRQWICVYWEPSDR